ncbi:TlpA family protein disulfide reductase [Pelosinus sp. sgz500959]|uniref:TlpA family protein disulfide reductase n=1 Tax=Pelosinus sp. sgz500959 TaxID=3242472 RepID=UPI00366FDE4E
MKRFKIVMGIMVIFLLVLGSICSAAPDTGSTVGKMMPQFTLNAVNGSSITVMPSDKVTIINFWATWCPPCRAEMPELNAFQLQYSDTVAFYGINLREEANFVNDFMYKKGYSMLVLLDSNGEVGNLFQIKFIPTTIVIDRNGIIIFRKSGPVTKNELETIINNL